MVHQDCISTYVKAKYEQQGHIQAAYRDRLCCCRLHCCIMTASQAKSWQRLGNEQALRLITGRKGMLRLGHTSACITSTLLALLQHECL